MEMKRVKVTTKEELDMLRYSVKGVLELIRNVRGIFGYDCFVEDSEQKIKVIDKLYHLLIFSAEPDDLNEQLRELESEDPKTCTFIYRFIKVKLGK